MDHMMATVGAAVATADYGIVNFGLFVGISRTMHMQRWKRINKTTTIVIGTYGRNVNKTEGVSGEQVATILVQSTIRRLEGTVDAGTLGTRSTKWKRINKTTTIVIGAYGRNVNKTEEVSGEQVATVQSTIRRLEGTVDAGTLRTRSTK
ncbi:unnamed protein product [Strongylus vulgaris]|uniref:Uncharacterized protein n=1 Tax=Strongylus vulgaris TaxID=40348 RepID=A0A3P7LJS5_STRVU|nr:unnamed protein product [Strongylus vulgaris]